MATRCKKCLAIQCVDCRFNDKHDEYWHEQIKNIKGKRDLYERYIEESYLISLPRNEQKLSMKIREREAHDLAEAMGFKIGSKVRNILTNEIFIVSSVWVIGSFNIEDIVFHVYKADKKTLAKVKSSINPFLSGCIMSIYTSKKILYGLDESRQRTCFYKPV